MLQSVFTSFKTQLKVHSPPAKHSPPSKQSSKCVFFPEKQQQNVNCLCKHLMFVHPCSLCTESQHFSPSFLSTCLCCCGACMYLCICAMVNGDDSIYLRIETKAQATQFPQSVAMVDCLQNHRSRWLSRTNRINGDCCYASWVADSI